MTLPAPELEHFLRALAGRRARWESSVRHSRDARIFEQVWDDEHVNAWLICWESQQDTGWHDHDDSAAAIQVLEGQVREERLRLLGAPISREVHAGSTFYVPPSAIHRVVHAGVRPAVTLHAYSPPLARTGAYRLGDDGQLERLSMSYEEELRAEAVLA